MFIKYQSVNHMVDFYNAKRDAMLISRPKMHQISLGGRAPYVHIGPMCI